MKFNYSLLTMLLLLSCAVYALENGTFSDNGFEYTELDELNTSFPSEGEIEDGSNDSDSDDEKLIVSELTDIASKNTTWNFELKNKSRDAITLYIYKASQDDLLERLLEAHSSLKTMDSVPALFKATLNAGKSVRLGGLLSDDDDSEEAFLLAVFNKKTLDVTYYLVRFNDIEITGYTVYENGTLKRLNPTQGITSSGLPLTNNVAVFNKVNLN